MFCVSRYYIIASFVLAMFTCHAVAAPAVSGVNAMASLQGGELQDDEAVLGLGSLSFPLATSFGVQIDAALGSTNSETLGGGGIHLFYRDPATALIGLYASHHEWNSVEVWRVAGEVELYLDRFSFEGLAGVEGLNVPGTLNGLQLLTQDEEYFFAIADIAYYVTDNLRISAGYRYVNEESLGAAEAEYLLNTSTGGSSFFVQGWLGDDDHTRITGGIRIYFGGEKNKTLIRRHREDDPRIRVPDFPIIQTMAPAISTPPPQDPCSGHEEQDNFCDYEAQ